MAIRCNGVLLGFSFGFRFRDPVGVDGFGVWLGIGVFYIWAPLFWGALVFAVRRPVRPPIRSVISDDKPLHSKVAVLQSAQQFLPALLVKLQPTSVFVTNTHKQEKIVLSAAVEDAPRQSGWSDAGLVWGRCWVRLPRRRIIAITQ